jgi:hypothetical protein
MSNRKNYRRGDEYRTEHGPRYESADPGKGCNSTHVARSRKKWSNRLRRKKRRIIKVILTKILKQKEYNDYDG